MTPTHCSLAQKERTQKLCQSPVQTTRVSFSIWLASYFLFIPMSHSSSELRSIAYIHQVLKVSFTQCISQLVLQKILSTAAPSTAVCPEARFLVSGEARGQIFDVLWRQTFEFWASWPKFLASMAPGRPLTETLLTALQFAIRTNAINSQLLPTSVKDLRKITQKFHKSTVCCIRSPIQSTFTIMHYNYNNIATAYNKPRINSTVFSSLPNAHWQMHFSRKNAKFSTMIVRPRNMKATRHRIYVRIAQVHTRHSTIVTHSRALKKLQTLCHWVRSEWNVFVLTDR